jgi:hypothetical protein
MLMKLATALTKARAFVEQFGAALDSTAYEDAQGDWRYLEHRIAQLEHRVENEASKAGAR